MVYAGLLTALIGMMALIWDVSTLRNDAHAIQTAADMSAVAGAMELTDAALLLEGGHPGCHAAWNYILANTREASPPPMHLCVPHSLPTVVCTPGLEVSQTQSTGPYEVTVTWPVPDDSPLLQPGVDPAADGASPCHRIAVRVKRTRGFTFAPVLGISQGTTLAVAVARRRPEATAGEIPAMLIR